MTALLTNATQRGWGNPGAPGSLAGKTYARNIVRVNVPLANGATIAVSVHRDIAAITYAAIHEASTVFTFNRTADDWGYAHRFIRGSKTTLSNHSWGLAIDLDATTNPMQARKPGKPVARTVTDRVVAVMAAHGFFWGGLYASRPDPMHFEISLTRAQARVMGASLIAAGKAPASLAPTKG